jgi:hypothetical protein
MFTLFRSHLLRWTGVVVTSAALLVGSGSAANAAPKTPAPTYRDCVVVVAPVEKGETYSRVVSRSCTTRSSADAPTESAVSTQDGASPQIILYNIIRFYQYSWWSGSTLTMRTYQPCYTVGAWAFRNTRPSDNGAGSWGASSWKAYNGCNHTTLYYGYDFGYPSHTYAKGTYGTQYISYGLNDHVWSASTTED